MEENKVIKLLIVDDSKLTTVGLSTTFKQYKDVNVVGIAENGKIAISMVQELKPDIVLMDIVMPIMDGIQATREIKKLNLSAKIIMLTSHDSNQNVFDALAAGAYSYCMKDVDPEVLLSVVRTTHEGASWLDPRIAKIVLGNFTKKPAKGPKNDEITLTDREIDVLNLIARGFSNMGISESLYISLNTVKTHIKNIFQKLEVEDRTQAVMTALKKNIINENQDDVSDGDEVY
jgi:DNA-binding NarL/FixJ family response regulator